MLVNTRLRCSCVGSAITPKNRHIRRTLQVHHRVTRLTSYIQEAQKGAGCTHGKTRITTCSTCTGHAYSVNDSTDSLPQRQIWQPDELGPNFGLLAEKLQVQWHGRLNRHLGNIVIKPHSYLKVWWSCDQCPDGLPHVWEATVNSRTQGMGCPFCSGTEVCQHNTLARKAPQVAQFWDGKKNFPLSPDQVTAFSRMKAHWKCSVCLHKWQAFVTSKAQGKTGCPRCAKANGGRKADGTRQKHPTFAGAKHALLEQWDHDKNRENGNFPDNTTLQSQKLIWWHCKECPNYQVHSWQARAAQRTSGRATGCPFCAGKLLCKCNSLETVCPDIAADFDSQTNGVSAAEVTSSASAKYSWLSDEPGAKRRSVRQRTGWAKRKLKIAARRS